MSRDRQIAVLASIVGLAGLIVGIVALSQNSAADDEWVRNRALPGDSAATSAAAPASESDEREIRELSDRLERLEERQVAESQESTDDPSNETAEDRESASTDRDDSDLGAAQSAAPEEAEDRDGFVLEYDAEDPAGNEAEQVVFEMELDEEDEVEDEVPATTTTEPNYSEIPLEEKVNGLRPLYADSKTTKITTHTYYSNTNETWYNENYHISTWDPGVWVTTDQESADGLIPKGAQVFHAGEWVEMPTWYSAKEIYNSYDFRLIGFCRTHDGLGLGGVEIFAGHGVDTTNLEYSVQILGEEPSSYWKSNNLWEYTAYGDLGTGIVNSDFGPEFGRSVLRFQTNNDSQPNVVRFILKIASKGSDQELKDFYDVVVRRSSSREKLIQLKLTRNKCTFDVAVMGTFTDESFESFKSGN